MEGSVCGHGVKLLNTNVNMGQDMNLQATRPDTNQGMLMYPSTAQGQLNVLWLHQSRREEQNQEPAGYDFKSFMRKIGESSAIRKVLSHSYYVPCLGRRVGRPTSEKVIFPNLFSSRQGSRF